MPGNYKRGVDTSISMLLALVRNDGGWTQIKDLISGLGIARSSAYRIIRAFAEIGLLERSSGRVSVGPLAVEILSRNAEAVRHKDRAENKRTRLWSNHSPLKVIDRISAKGEIALSAPISPRSRSHFRIGFSNCSMSNPWRVALVHAIEHGASKLSDIIKEIVIRHADDDAGMQACNIDEFLDHGVDGLIVSALDDHRVAAALERAKDRQVAVVLVDRRTQFASNFASLVTSDDLSIGETTALWLCEKLCGKGDVLILCGHKSAAPAHIRLNAALKVFARFEGIRIIDVKWTGWLRDAGKAATREVLQRQGSKISGVWCDSGLSGAGSIEAFLDFGYRDGTIPPHTGGDVNLMYKLAVRHSVPIAAIDFPPLMGQIAVESMISLLDGRWIPKTINIASDIIISDSHDTITVKATRTVEEHVQPDLPDDVVLGTGLGKNYSPAAFRVSYPGNLYNRSAATLIS